MDINDFTEILRTKTRTLRNEDPVLYCLADIMEALRIAPDDDQFLADLKFVPAQMRPVRALRGPGGITQEPMITVHGLAIFLASASTWFLRTLAVDLLEDAMSRGLNKATRHSVKKESGSAWGEQPARALIRKHNLSVAEFVRMVNTVPGLPKGRVLYPTMSAVLTGRQLPSPDLLYRVLYVLQCNPVQAMSQQALTAYERKYGPTGHLAAPAPAQQQQQPDPVPVVEPDDDPIDWDEEERKAEAALAEAFGAASFQASFNTVTGGDSSPSDSDEE